jgi:hypothetical protein
VLSTCDGEEVAVLTRIRHKLMHLGIRRPSLTAAGVAAVPAYHSGLLRPDRTDPHARRHAIESSNGPSWRHTVCGLPAVLVDLTGGDWRELPTVRQCQACHLAVRG